MGFLDEAEQARLRQDPSGLEIARYWQRAATHLPEGPRRLLSHVASSLMSRGWLPAADKMLAAAADQLGEPLPRVEAWAEQLTAVDLLHMADGKFAVVAGLLSTRPTGLTFHFDDRHEIHLNGPLAALAVSRALQRSGEIRSSCGEDKTTALHLHADLSGITAHAPADMALFLPAWDGAAPPSAAALGGGFFRDDEALDRWQARQGQPGGMPVAAMMLPMASMEIGERLGSALQSLLDHLPDYD